jgi:Kinesin motor domain
MPKRLELPDDEPLPDSETDNVKVFVRTRPVNQREIELGAWSRRHAQGLAALRLPCPWRGVGTSATGQSAVRLTSVSSPAGGSYKCLEVTGPQSLRLETTPSPHNYTFDCVASENFTQEALYEGELHACTMYVRAMAIEVHEHSGRRVGALRLGAHGAAVAGRPIVDNCLNGFNSCIFAYGQTGAGKT